MYRKPAIPWDNSRIARCVYIADWRRGYFNLIYAPLTLGPSFSVRPENEAKAAPLKKKGWLGQGFANAYFADFDH